ncbi:MAG: oxaloacetate-decarboxylating malate dehydrogenase, partial [Desulfobulbaceae bacterium]|nr:oxaloacetate-decarboxylating malate dehydrogenase [Desulfobulbaceae bacterium]
WRHSRLKGKDYVEFIQRFARAFKIVYPNALCQWEDFSKQNAFAIRDAYLHDLISFNDDIQGTGAVTLAAVLTAMKIKKEQLKDQVFLIHGAGAGGVGIAEQIETVLVEDGLLLDEARKRIFTLDSRGIVATNRKLEPYKKKFAKDPAAFPWLGDQENNALLQGIRKAGITVLIGTSGQTGCFTEEVVRAMLANTERPVILPLSNPTEMAEAQPVDIYRQSKNRALVATGSPFSPVTVDEREVRIGQCNNVFVFPGVGLGVLASGARQVLPSFFTAAAHAVSNQISEEDIDNGILMPPVDRLREISLQVACAVAKAALKEKVSGLCVYSTYQHDNNPDRIEILIERMRWSPRYLPVSPA